MYKSPTKECWQGRTDPLDGAEGHRWHHVIQLVDLSADAKVLPNQRPIALLGFCCDEGVARNSGRVGARQGPEAIRKALANVAVHFDEEQLTLCDVGDVLCQHDHMEAAQHLLGQKVARLLSEGARSIVLGGGHEVAYGHFLGIHAHAQATHLKTGIINIDAHFDLRKFQERGSSGTPFLQIAELLEQSGASLHYLVLGINEAANTRALFNKAEALGVDWLTAEALNEPSFDVVEAAIGRLQDQCDQIYLTIDMDVFNASVAPGVSAPAPYGIFPDKGIQLLKYILATRKVISIDLAEVNPLFDIDQRTSKLAAYLIHTIVSHW